MAEHFTAAEKTGHRLIAVFNGLLATLFLALLVSNIGEVRRPGPEATASDIQISGADCGLDLLGLASLLAATFALVSGRGQAAVLQRAVCWALLLRTGFIFAEATLPSDGGVGGFLMLIAGLFFATATIVAFGTVAYLRYMRRGDA